MTASLRTCSFLLRKTPNLKGGSQRWQVSVTAMARPTATEAQPNLK